MNWRKALGLGKLASLFTGASKPLPVHCPEANPQKTTFPLNENYTIILEDKRGWNMDYDVWVEDKNGNISRGKTTYLWSLINNNLRHYNIRYEAHNASSALPKSSFTSNATIDPARERNLPHRLVTINYEILKARIESLLIHHDHKTGLLNIADNDDHAYYPDYPG